MIYISSSIPSLHLQTIQHNPTCQLFDAKHPLLPVHLAWPLHLVHLAWPPYPVHPAWLLLPAHLAWRLAHPPREVPLSLPLSIPGQNTTRSIKAIRIPPCRILQPRTALPVVPARRTLSVMPQTLWDRLPTYHPSYTKSTKGWHPLRVTLEKNL